MTNQWQEGDYRRTVESVEPARLLKNTNVEIVRRPPSHQPPTHVLFDFDGTLSLIREGWPDVMVPMMVEVLARTGTAETAEQLYQTAHEFVMQLNGKQTIYQMIRLADEVRRRGGEPESPAAYKARYHDLLMHRIADRHRQLESNAVPREDMLVPDTIPLLDELRSRGVTLYLASGTDEPYVLNEARLLGLDAYFGRHIYGAQEDYKSFSKAQVIDRILSQNQIDGSMLLGFGDGYVEIQNVKSVGGTAVAVASDEAGRSGKPDAWKRDRLIGVGADLVIPDYRHGRELLAYLWGEVE